MTKKDRNDGTTGVLAMSQIESRLKCQARICKDNLPDTTKAFEQVIIDLMNRTANPQEINHYDVRIKLNVKFRTTKGE